MNKENYNKEDKKGLKATDKVIKSSCNSSTSGRGSRKDSLNEAISELEQHPEIIKEKYKDIIESSTSETQSANIYNNSLDVKPEKKKFSLSRFLFALTFFSLAFSNSYFKIYVPPNHPTGITDFIHKQTEQLHIFLKENEDVRISLVTTTAFIQDLGFLFLAYFWIMKGTNWRPFTTLVLFLSAKMLNSISFTFIPIEGYIWDAPDYPSLTYPANQDYNFFFTGLVGFNFICFEFLYDIHSQIATLFSFMSLINAVFQFFFFIGLRASYVIDVGSSLLVAHYFYYLSEIIEPFFDKIFSLKDKEEEIKEDIIKKLNEENERISELESLEDVKIGQDEVFLKRKHEK